MANDSNIARPDDYRHVTDGKCLACGARTRPGESTCSLCTTKPKHATIDDVWVAKDGVKGLETTIENGDRWPLCPCGGKCKLVCLFGGETFWKCEDCGHKHYQRPLVTQANDYRSSVGILRAILRKDGP